jgi:Subtilase family
LPASPASSSSLRSLRAYPNTLVELSHVDNGGAEFALRQAGGVQIAPEIALWRVPSAAAARLLPALRATGLVRSVTPDVALRSSSSSALAAPPPHFSAEWWIPHVGADRWTPPGPGVPLTMIDSGVDANNPEFLNRPNTAYLNPQTFTATEEELHGTATASVAAAPGVAITGMYPKAKLQLWDASPGGELTVGDEIAGLADAVRHGRSVINLSLGGFDRLPVEEHAILAAFGAGSLVIASAGNDRHEGSPLSYPASFAHVLTVGATDESDAVADFSSSSPHMDLAAPGEDMEVAVPSIWAPGGATDPYDVYDGTSFSAPLVSGAAAAVWTLRPTLTNTQLFEVMRRSAHHKSKRGWNRNTGYGILDAPAAVTRKAPAADPQEPNEDVYLVRPNGLFRTGHPPLTAPGRSSRVLRAHVEQDDDPEDVYRAYLPTKGRMVVTVKTRANVNLEVWGRRTKTVFERGAAAKRDLLASSARAGARTERVVVRGRGVGQYVYLDVFLAKRSRETNYTIRVGTARR